MRAVLAKSRVCLFLPPAVVDRSTVENVFHGIQTNGFAASSASLGVLVELISKYVMSFKHTSTSFVQPSAVHPLLLTAFPFVFLSEPLLRCVAETTNEDSNDQCADVVSVIVSVGVLLFETNKQLC